METYEEEEERRETQCTQPRAEIHIERSSLEDLLEYTVAVNSRRKQVGGHQARHLCILEVLDRLDLPGDFDSAHLSGECLCAQELVRSYDEGGLVHYRGVLEGGQALRHGALQDSFLDRVRNEGAPLLAAMLLFCGVREDIEQEVGRVHRNPITRRE